MTWNVYRYDINKREIEVYNVFEHYSFNLEVEKLLNKKISYGEFYEELKSLAMYYFWSKSEYEVVITEFPPYIDKEEIDRLVAEKDEHSYRTYVHLEVSTKIDIYGQLNLNWEQFALYVWGFAKQTKNKR